MEVRPMEVRPIDANALLSRCREMYDRHDNIVCAYDEIDAASTLSLNTLRDTIYQDAVAHGLWDGVTQNPYKLRTYCADLLQEEIFELSEEYENVQCYIEELADVVIMCFSVAGRLDIDIDAAIRRKMEINKGRAWKHGKE